MTGPLSGKKIALIIASKGFHPVEYNVPKEILRKEGAMITTVSDKPGGAIAKDKSTANVDITLDQLNPQDFNGVFFIGGPGALDCLDNPISYKIVADCKKHDIPYGAICISTRILAKGYGLEGKKATGWNDDLGCNALYPSFGAELVDHPVVTDGLVVTAVGPAAAEGFAESIRRVIMKKKLS